MCKTFSRNTWEQRGGSVGEILAMQGDDLCSDFQHPYKKAQCGSICGNPRWEGKEKWLPGPC